MSNDQVQSRQGLTETCSTTQILSDLEHRLSTKMKFYSKIYNYLYIEGYHISYTSRLDPIGFITQSSRMHSY